MPTSGLEETDARIVILMHGHEYKANYLPDSGGYENLIPDVLEQDRIYKKRCEMRHSGSTI